MSRLAVRVARLLCERGAEVVALVNAGDELVALLPDTVKVVTGDGPGRDARPEDVVRGCLFG